MVDLRPGGRPGTRSRVAAASAATEANAPLSDRSGQGPQPTFLDDVEQVLNSGLLRIDNPSPASSPLSSPDGTTDEEDTVVDNAALHADARARSSRPTPTKKISKKKKKSNSNSKSKGKGKGKARKKTVPMLELALAEENTPAPLQIAVILVAGSPTALLKDKNIVNIIQTSHVVFTPETAEQFRDCDPDDLPHQLVIFENEVCLHAPTQPNRSSRARRPRPPRARQIAPS
jgi:hypothetical protein